MALVHRGESCGCWHIGAQVLVLLPFALRFVEEAGKARGL